MWFHWYQEDLQKAVRPVPETLANVPIAEQKRTKRRLVELEAKSVSQLVKMAYVETMWREDTIVVRVVATKDGGAGYT